MLANEKLGNFELRKLCAPTSKSVKVLENNQILNANKTFYVS